MHLGEWDATLALGRQLGDGAFGGHLCGRSVFHLGLFLLYCSETESTIAGKAVTLGFAVDMRTPVFLDMLTHGKCLDHGTKARKEYGAFPCKP
jgi:hypothetical protein